jgi:hypothetical protein
MQPWAHLRRWYRSCGRGRVALATSLTLPLTRPFPRRQAPPIPSPLLRSPPSSMCQPCPSPLLRLRPTGYGARSSTSSQCLVPRSVLLPWARSPQATSGLPSASLLLLFWVLESLGWLEGWPGSRPLLVLRVAQCFVYYVFFLERLYFRFQFSFVLFAAIKGWTPAYFLLEKTHSVFHCQEHSSFHSFHSTSVLFF